MLAVEALAGIPRLTSRRARPSRVRTLAGPLNTAILFPMKTSIDLPDELYRRVKARSALEGRAVREVTTELLAQWVDRKPSPPGARDAVSVAPAPNPDWLYEWAALGARVAKATAPRAAGAKRGGASTKGAKKHPTGLVGQLKRDRR